ncbi:MULTISPECIES: CTB family bacteriocin [unclassified Tolypothrix]|uniref:CTB family bacteriocin n=1 Tax=unclassified Tolypothrix TaxID=2649714 RepID=UPI0005EAACF2|nr:MULTISPECIES: CTB family bacteriocin [unclassified Tolypothrix]EKF01883.1 hypothetical protein FDUTEX481_07489 [Tolypothrix sp. PCC 7601]MBE9088089.1 CTB family bacteriocin [Tolypothrix sp. LEGE 11397]UYD23688.1 CTB family bacteriocin [Tolypothrix sp. PCC 7712]UYD34088.1 CTB family bacteriocin [Tolypothrix sp. PCC 7601]
MSDHIQPQELSAEELDNVAGGASRFAAAATSELDDAQISSFNAGRNGIQSNNLQETVDFKAALVEFTQTGK